MSSPMKLTSSASFSPSIRISLRLKIHQAQAKNFCRVLDIRVTKIVIANFPQTVLLQKLCKGFGEIMWGEQPSHFIHTDVTQIVLVIAFAAHTLKFVLLLLFMLQKLLESRDQGQRSHAGFRFGYVLSLLHSLSVNVTGYNRMPDGYRVILEVDSVPFQADGLASAQTIKRSEKDGDFKFTPFCGFKEFLDFGTIVKAADKRGGFGAIHLCFK